MDHDAGDLESFLARAEAVNKAVRGLASGETPLSETTALLAELEGNRDRKVTPAVEDPAVAALRAEQKAKAEEARKRAGVRGQGAREGYQLFCKHCFLEYELPPLPTPLPNGESSAVSSFPSGSPPPTAAAAPRCATCHGPLMTRGERRGELEAKVATLKAAKAERARRRAEFKAFKAARERDRKVVVVASDTSSSSASSALAGTYASWEAWEPSSDSDPDPLEPDDPQFAALKADIDARAAKKKVDSAAAEAANARGAELVKQGKWLDAAEAYSTAIQAVRAEKRYWANRSLCYLHAFRYADAEADATAALEIWSCFEAPHTRYHSDYSNAKTVFKVLLRRGKARLDQGKVAEAREDAEQAAKTMRDLLYPAKSEARNTPDMQKAKKTDLAEVAKLAEAISEKERFGREEKGGDPTAQVRASATTGGGAKPKEEEHKEASSSVSTSFSAAPPVATSPELAAFLSAVRAAHTALLNCSANSATGKVLPSQPDFSSFAASFFPTSLTNAEAKARAAELRSSGGLEALAAHARALLAFVAPMTSDSGSDASLTPSPALRAAAMRLVSQLSTRPGARELLGSRANAPAVLDATLATLNSPANNNESQVQAADALANVCYAPAFRRWLLSSPSARFERCVSVLLQAAQASSFASSAAPLTALLNLLTAAQARTRLLAAPAIAATLSESSARSSAAAGTVPQVGKQVDAWLASFFSLLSAAVERSPSSREVIASQAPARVALETATKVLRLSTESAGEATAPSITTGKAEMFTPLQRLLALLIEVLAAWAPLLSPGGGPQKQAPSGLIDRTERLLACLLNLCVDDTANRAVFAALLARGRDGEEAIKRLLLLAGATVNVSDASLPASATSLRFPAVPAIIIERAMGLLTRGLRREHQDASAASASQQASGSSSSPPRPLRALVLAENGWQTFLATLAAHPFTAMRDPTSADAVLERLHEGAFVAEDDDGSAPSASAAAAPMMADAPFQFTRSCLEHASVCLAVCLSGSAVVAEQAAAFEFQRHSGMAILVDLLNSPSSNVVGNVALCIDALTAVPRLRDAPELGKCLDRLLAILRDPALFACHNNAAKAAILIGRAPNNVERWTAMRGVEIVAKAINHKK